ncbi:MAG TPA: hypothetical protein VGL19_19290, partial [Polyangiaceae bacterium]
MRGRALGFGVASLLALGAHARAAAAEGAQASAVWYRAAAECPSGADFLAKIEGTAQAHLAQGGEHIDFVVTLLTSGAETVGRLERQKPARGSSAVFRAAITWQGGVMRSSQFGRWIAMVMLVGCNAKLQVDPAASGGSGGGERRGTAGDPGAGRGPRVEELSTGNGLILDLTPKTGGTWA